MKEHDATELAYKNGYKKAVEDIFGDILKIKGLELHDWEAIAELKKKYMGE